MIIEGVKGKQVKKGVWSFNVPQFKGGNNSSSHQWLQFRKNFIGASEVGTIMGLNEFGVAAKVFYSKVGKIFSPFHNKYTIFGKEAEPIIGRKFWQYYDGTRDGYVKNYSEGNIIRKCRSSNCFFVNEKYPNIAVSPDFIVNKNQYSYFLNQTVKYPYPLEIKSMSKYVVDKYENGIPPQYIAQVMTQMMVMDVDYAEFAALIDRDLEVRPFELTEAWKEKIITSSNEFWNKILHAKELVKLMETLETEEEKGIVQQRIDNLAPEPEATKAYEEYIKEAYKEGRLDATIKGDEIVWSRGVAYDNYQIEIKKLEKLKQLEKNELLTYMKDHEEIVFDDGSKVVYRRKSETRRKDYFNVKIQK